MVLVTTYMTLVAAVMLSAVAAYFSVLGLMEIFSASAQAVMVMAIVLELTKVITAYWAHLNWNMIPWTIKSYLTTAVIILMGITSLGIYGFLAKAHITQKAEISTTYGSQTNKLEAQVRNFRAQQAAIDRRLKVIEDVVSTAAEKGYVSKSLELNKKYAPEQEELYKQKNEIESRILDLEQQKVEVASKRELSETKVGPIKYVVNLVYGDANAQELNSAVRWLIVILVAVFDPLAIFLLIGTGYILRQVQKPVRVDVPAPVTPKVRVIKKATGSTDDNSGEGTTV